ncbi:tetratricopeptide repeat protein [Allofustis seminis]|uniref:tetratricopeptide repeat protein n=1 Tax=Allofustis seminis TaxID=166939 RepID=UPI0003766059|nr:hypothetical protein [Allofustis seminis]
MKNTANPKEPVTLPQKIKSELALCHYHECEEMIIQAICENPHAALPHNLYGILLEVTGDHPLAMKHFRAAWDLDPTFLPARLNLIHMGTFKTADQKKFIFDSDECETVNI